MAVMATGALAIFSQILGVAAGSLMLKFLALIFLGVAGGVFVLAIFGFLARAVICPSCVKKDFLHPVSSKFFAGISIASAILSTAISKIVIPEKLISLDFAVQLATSLYWFGIVFGVIVIFSVCAMLICSEKVEQKHAIGIWLLPPVGLFVNIFAGNFLVPHWSVSFSEKVLIFHLFLIGVAFVIFAVVQMMIFFRMKFQPLPPASVAPSFFIPLAPVGVSLIAFFSLAAATGSIESLAHFSGAIKNFLVLYTPFILGFGFFWFGITLILFFSKYLKRGTSIPFSLGFFAFVFPTAALGISLATVSLAVPVFGFLIFVAKFFWVLSVGLWGITIVHVFRGIFSGTIFQRPDGL